HVHVAALTSQRDTRGCSRNRAHAWDMRRRRDKYWMPMCCCARDSGKFLSRKKFTRCHSLLMRALYLRWASAPVAGAWKSKHRNGGRGGSRMRTHTGLTRAFLMEASEARIAGLAREGSTMQALIARRMIEEPHLYRHWEREHDRLMRTVA